MVDGRFSIYACSLIYGEIDRTKSPSSLLTTAVAQVGRDHRNEFASLSLLEGASIFRNGLACYHSGWQKAA